MDGAYIPQADIADAWLKATGDSPICHITMPASRSKAASYIAKYVAKPADIAELAEAPLCEFVSALCGRRTLITFGTAHGAGLPVKLPANEPTGSTHLCPIYAARRAFSDGHEFAHELASLVRHSLPVAYKLITGDYDPPLTSDPGLVEPPWERIAALFSECSSWHYDGSSRLSNTKNTETTQRGGTPPLLPYKSPP